MVVQTALGECDLGLTGEAVRTGGDGGMAFRVLAETAADLAAQLPGFDLPPGVQQDGDGRPVVPGPGLLS